MLEYKGDIDIKVNLQNGIYTFRNNSGIGKSYLVSLLKSYAADGEPVMAYTYTDMIIGVQFNNVVKPGEQKLLVIDRYDLYSDAFTEQIEKFAETGVVLIDIKGSTNLQSKLCYLDMTEHMIEVSE